MTSEKAVTIQKANTIRAYLEGQKKQLALAVPKHLPVDRLLRVAMTSIQQTPKLLDCTPVSLLRCVMTCAQLGLEPDQFLGQAYLVPFWNSKKSQTEAQLIPGYRGYISLARRSGEVQSVSSQVVYTNDHFLLQYGIDEKLEHRPVEGDRGTPRGAYVIFKYKDGGYSFDYMSAADIEKIRSRSKAKDSGPWVTDWDEMGKKTVIKRHAKLAPLSVEFQKAVALEDRAYTGESQEGIFDTLNGDVIDAEHESKDVEALAKQFDNTVGKLETIDQDQLKAFLAKAVETFNMSEDEVKAEAMKNFDNFMDQFNGWKQPGKPEQNKPEASEKDPIREEYINLRTKGFKPWVMANLQRIPQLEGHYQKEIISKWSGFYPNERYPWVEPENVATDEIAVPGGDSEEQTEPRTPTGPDPGLTKPPPPSPEDKAIMSLIEGSKHDIAGRLCVPCPNQDGRAILFSHCEEGCQERVGCPTFEEYDKR